MAWITVFCLAIEQTADTSFLSGKGMGFCMLIALCLNADYNLRRQRARIEANMKRLEKEYEHYKDSNQE